MITQNFKKEKAIMIARYFIKKNEKDSKGLTLLKLQKLLYYAQAWNLVFNKKEIFPNKIEAWVHGPVVPEVWEKFKDFDFSIAHFEISEDEFAKLEEKEKELLDDVWKVYGKFDGEYLELLTHHELPWREARKHLSELEPSQNIISSESMQNYYTKKLQDALASRHQKTKG